jgi:NADPH:quinone reductase-like Zn-dependent oxidoreductase
MSEPRNRVVQVTRFGEAEGLQVVDAPLPTAGPGEVRVRMLGSGIEYTDVLIRRHLYPQTSRLRPPFVMGYGSSAKSINSAMACATFSLVTEWPT